MKGNIKMKTALTGKICAVRVEANNQKYIINWDKCTLPVRKKYMEVARALPI